MMHRRIRIIVVFLVALGLLAACSQESDPTVPFSTSTSTPRTGTIGATNAVSPTTASKAASVAQVGNFSVAVMDIVRTRDSAIVYFVITKVTSGATSTEQTPQKLQITLKDDHNNQYSGLLTTDLSGAPPEMVLHTPLGFSYTDNVAISIPEKAPIQTILFGSGKELAFKDITFVKPTFRPDFKEVVTPGSVVPIGKFLRVTPERMIPDLFTWASLITIENQDYNVINGKIQVVAQYTDGTIKTSTPAGKAFSVSGLSKESVQPTIPYPKAGVPYFMLLFFYSGEFAESGALTLWPVVESDFPPRVGQGLEQSVEYAFVNVYQKEMGNPINVPHWFSGNNAPAGDSDVLVQEFPTGAIVWGWHNGAGQAHALDGGIWNTYLTLGGPKGWLGPPIGPSEPYKGFPFFDFQGGYIATRAEIVNKPFRYPSGRLAYDCGDAVCTVDLDIKGTVARAINKTQIVSGFLSPDAAFSPDGTLVAYGESRDGGAGRVCRTDGSHCVEQGLRQPRWSPDGTSRLRKKGVCARIGAW